MIFFCINDHFWKICYNCLSIMSISSFKNSFSGEWYAHKHFVLIFPLIWLFLVYQIMFMWCIILSLTYGRTLTTDKKVIFKILHKQSNDNFSPKKKEKGLTYREQQSRRSFCKLYLPFATVYLFSWFITDSLWLL